MESNRQNAPLLQVQGLTVSFSRYAKGFRRVTLPGVRDLSFSLDEGELVAVVGASGSGKSLLAHRLLGILPHNAQVAGKYSTGASRWMTGWPGNCGDMKLYWFPRMCPTWTR